jgi:hypothetical protein
MPLERRKSCTMHTHSLTPHFDTHILTPRFETHILTPHFDTHTHTHTHTQHTHTHRAGLTCCVPSPSSRTPALALSTSWLNPPTSTSQTSPFPGWLPWRRLWSCLGTRCGGCMLVPWFTVVL